MFCHVLNGELEPDVARHAARYCRPGAYIIDRDEIGQVIIGFRDEDRAMLFLNLFEGEIMQSFEAHPEQSAA